MKLNQHSAPKEFMWVTLKKESRQRLRPDDVLVRNVTEYGVSRARTFVRAQLVLSVTPIAPTFSKAVLKNMLRMEVQGFFRSV